MQDAWYADKRDLVKWGALFQLADNFKVGRIMQIAYYRPSQFGQLEVDGKPGPIPEEVIAHFRDLRAAGSLGSKVRVTVFDPCFTEDRGAYQKAVLALLSAFAQEPCIVFLDPDTGLAPRSPKLEHVLGEEARGIWEKMKVGDVFAFYQHQTNMAGKPWVPLKRNQLAEALGVPQDAIKVANAAPPAVQDIAIFYVRKE
jgi:hypothetical protein